MRKEARRVNIVRISGVSTIKQRDLVVREAPATIFLDDTEIVTLMCSPKDLDYLAVGFLFGEGLIPGRREIKAVFADAKDRAVWVETVGLKKSGDNIPSKRVMTTGCGKGTSFLDLDNLGKKRIRDTSFRVRASRVMALMQEFQKRSHIYKRTGGVHSAGLANARGIVFFSEDIGRHNAVDKVIGEWVLRGTRTNRLLLITSGRVSSDVIAKVARAGIPIVVSKAAPTDVAVEVANKLGITLVGFARGSRMNVYSNDWRIPAALRIKE